MAVSFELHQPSQDPGDRPFPGGSATPVTHHPRAEKEVTAQISRRASNAPALDEHLVMASAG